MLKLTKQTLLALVILIASACLYMLFIPKVATFNFGDNTTYDFLQYWSAFQIFISGENVYSASKMLATQRIIGNTGPQAVMMWNPPWTLIILSPILIFDFPQAAALWIFCNIVFLLLSTALLTKVYRANTRPLQLFVPCILFFPVWEALNWGQLSVFLLFSVSLFLYGMHFRKDSLSALALVGMTVKPQLFIVLGIALGWDILISRRWKLLFMMAALFGTLALATKLVSPEAIYSWLHAASALSGADPARSVYHWKPATIVTWVRIIVPGINQNVIWIMPLAMATLTLSYLFAKKAKISWIVYGPMIISLSLLAAPYAWFYDQAILLVVQLALFLSFLNLQTSLGRKLMYAVLVTQLSYAMMMASNNIAQHHYAIFLVVWFLVSALTTTQLKIDPQLEIDPQ